MEETVLEFRGVSFAYEGEHEALRNLSVSVKRGGRIAVLGENGAGKSTFFLLCNGVLKPDSGEIYCKGKKLDSSSKSRLMQRQTVGIVFQEPDSQIIASTVAEEISFGPMNLGLSREEVAKRVETVLERMKLTGMRNRPPHYLSGGEKKRVTIADILAMQPEVMLFDEPASSLDPGNAALLEQTLRELSEEGLTLLISTHDVNFAWRWAERVLVFSHGELVADRTPEQVFADDRLLAESGLKKPLLFEMGQILQQTGVFAAGKIPREMSEFREWAERMKR